MVSAGRLVASLFALAALVLGASVAAAQASPPPPAPTPELTTHPEGHGTTASGSGTALTTSAPPSSAAPAPTPAFDPEAATRAWLAKVPAADKERSDAYFEGGYWLQLWDLVYTLAVAWVLLGTGISRRLRELAQRTTRFRPLQTGIYALGYTLLVAVLGFPLNAYRGFFREHKYGLSNQNFGEWMSELGKGLGVGLVLGTLGLMLFYGVLRRTPRTWWIWGSLVVLALLAVSIVIAPVYIAPLFNKYTALTDPKVRDPILRMAQANGVPVDNVWVFDASKQTKRISANVSGFLGTERVSLNDNLLERSTLPEIESVMGHELGHYVLNHVYELFLELGLVVVFGFLFLRATFDRVPAPVGRALGRHRCRRPRRAAAARGAARRLLLPRHAGVQHHHPQQRGGGRRLRPQRGAAAGRLRLHRAQARRIPQARPRPDRGVALLRPPERQEPHPDGDALEGGASRRDGRSVRTAAVSAA